MVFSSSDIRIEKLRREHDLSGFSSYEPELESFLREDAFDNQRKKISVTYLWFLKKRGCLVGYISLLNDRINLEGELKSYFHGKGILYKSLPALKIGRLCVDDRFLREGIGSLMVGFAYKKAVEISENIAGCRFITLDAKEDSVFFYRKLNFLTLERGAMYLDISK